MPINQARVKLYLGYITRGGHFEIVLCRRGAELTDAVYEAAVDNFLEPLLPVAERAILFWDPKPKARSLDRAPLPSNSMTKNAELLEVDPVTTKLTDHRSFWKFALQGMPGAEGVLALYVPKAKLPLHLIAEHAWDPHYLTMPGYLAPYGALCFCKETAKRATHVACLFTRDALGINLSFYAASDTLKKAYVACVKHGQFNAPALEKELRLPTGKVSPAKGRSARLSKRVKRGTKL